MLQHSTLWHNLRHHCNTVCSCERCIHVGNTITGATRYAMLQPDTMLQRYVCGTPWCQHSARQAGEADATGTEQSRQAPHPCTGLCVGLTSLENIFSVPHSDARRSFAANRAGATVA
jgi:hypothetical protein